MLALIRELCANAGRMLPFRASKFRVEMGNRAFLLASAVLLFGMPTTLLDDSTVGMAPLSGCMNVDDAPESMIPDNDCRQKLLVTACVIFTAVSPSLFWNCCNGDIAVVGRI